MGDGGDSSRPHNLRTILLAYPKICTKKYKPPKYKPGSVDSGVCRAAKKFPLPPSNKRLKQLAEMPIFKRTKKWVFVPQKGVGSGVPQSALTIEASRRTAHLALPPHRYLRLNQREFKFLGQPFVQKMSKFIDQSWNSMYNFYNKQKLELRLKRLARKKALRLAALKAKLKGKKGVQGGKPIKELSPKELKIQKMKEFDAWAKIRAKPKRVFPPRKPRKRKIANLIKIAAHVRQMAQPRNPTRKYIRPSLDDLYVDPFAVKKGAKTYKITDRMKELAEVPAVKLVKERLLIPGAVKRSALTCKVSPRFTELAVPKRKAAEKESDEKENPFSISPYALKAKATQRTKELAKPIDR